MNKHKKFIKDAYNGKFGSICDDWKETIEEHYPEFKNKLEVGKWYKYKKWNDIMFMTEPDNLKVKGYGFDNGCWFDNRSTNMYYGFTNKSENWTLATKDEVEKAFIAEAEKRGFDKNDASNVVCLKGYNKYKTQEHYKDVNSGFEYEHREGQLWIINSCFLSVCIFDNGKWAEIITKKKMTLKEIENKLGHEIELVLD